VWPVPVNATTNTPKTSFQVHDIIFANDVADIIRGMLHPINESASSTVADGYAGLLRVVDQISDHVGEEFSKGFWSIHNERKRSLTPRRCLTAAF
jgi:ribosomal protein L11 methylase PrmA